MFPLIKLGRLLDKGKILANHVFTFPAIMSKAFLSYCCLTHYQTTNFTLFKTERVCRRQFQMGRKWKKVIQTGRKHCGKRRNCSLQAISPFPTVLSTRLENFLPFSTNLKLSSANFTCLEESKICCLAMG